MAYYIHAWNQLTTCRRLDKLQPISWEACHLWAQYENMSRDAFDDLWYFVSAIDIAYLNVQAENMKNGNANRSK